MINKLPVLLLILFFASSFAEAQVKIYTRNAGVVNGKQTIELKWYTKELVYPEGVNIYRKEIDRSEVVKINAKPIKKLTSLTNQEFAEDSSLKFFVTLANKVKLSELKDFRLLTILLKSFYSPVYSNFLGIYFKDTTVQMPRTYEYRIMKLVKGKEVLLGTSEDIRAGQESPIAAVTEISVKPDTSKVNIKWRTEEERFWGVDVYRSIGSSDKIKLNAQPLLISPQTNQQGKQELPKVFYTDDSLKPGTYTYYLAGVDFFGKETQLSQGFTIEVKDLIPPSPPQELKDSTFSLNVYLKWKHGKEADNDLAGYNIYRSPKSNGTYIKINDKLLSRDSLKYHDKVEKAGPYYYYVSAVDSSKNESKSFATFAEVHDIVPPDAPTGLTAKADTGKIILSWDKNKEGDVTGYLIFRTINKNDKDKFALLNTNPIKETNYTDALPKVAKNRFVYKIIAIDSSYNKSDASVPATAVMPDVLPPVKPYIKKVYNFEKSIIVEWMPNKEPDLKGYDIYRSKNKGMFEKQNKELLNKEFYRFNDEGVESGIEYIYYLVAVDSSGNRSESSNRLLGVNRYDIKIKSPAHFVGGHLYKENWIRLNWQVENPEKLMRIVVYRKEGEKGKLAPLPENASGIEFFDKHVEKGKTYYYQLRLFSTTGDYTKSELIKITTRNK